MLIFEFIEKVWNAYTDEEIRMNKIRGLFDKRQEIKTKFEARINYNESLENWVIIERANIAAKIGGLESVLMFAAEEREKYAIEADIIEQKLLSGYWREIFTNHVMQLVYNALPH